MMVMMPCPGCQGYRVGGEARRITPGGKCIRHLGCIYDHCRVKGLPEGFDQARIVPCDLRQDLG